MAHWLATDPALRPDLPTRERVPGSVEARCPACGQWRPGFTIAALDPAEAAVRGHDWACDGDRARWAREITED
jgi:hypothetical protein